MSAACAPLASSANTDPTIGAITRGSFIVSSQASVFVSTSNQPSEKHPRLRDVPSK
jgi:hypothetical protein